MGPDTSDDAAVYRLSDDLALVLTVDYFTAIVDDPYAFGQIAAANSLSDVYAMGGRPIAMLSIVGFPRQHLAQGILGEILKGGAAKAQEAGVSVVGGHSIDDTEPKIGYAVAGLIHPARIWRNVGARPGDALVLTKPVGTGIITTALKEGHASVRATAAATRVMTTLNRAAADAAATVVVHAATDITGFGLLGHVREMALGSGVRVRLDASRVPVLPDVMALAAQGMVPGGTRRNLRAASAYAEWHPAVDAAWQAVLADAQTSGGLLLASPDPDGLLAALAREGVEEAAQVGTVVSEDPRAIVEVRP